MIGDLVARRVGDRVVVDRADPVILVSRQFLTQADPALVSCDGRMLTFTASNGMWVYQIVSEHTTSTAYRCVKVSGA